MGIAVVSLFLALTLLLHVALAVHAVRYRTSRWILFSLLIPVAGALFYSTLMVWIALAARSSVASAARVIRTRREGRDRELHRLRAALAVFDDIPSRLALVLSCLEHGLYAEAIANLEILNDGECRDDPLILLGLARAYFGLEQFRHAKDSLDHLIAVHPSFRSEAGHLLYARSLESLGEIDNALHEYEVLTSYSRAPEAVCRRALLLTQVGRSGEARDLYESLLDTLRRGPRRYTQLHRQWLALAEREMAALVG